MDNMEMLTAKGMREKVPDEPSSSSGSYQKFPGAQEAPARSSAGSVPPPPNDVDLDADIDLEEDEDYLTD
jgi:hypothetical protein